MKFTKNVWLGGRVAILERRSYILPYLTYTLCKILTLLMLVSQTPFNTSRPNFRKYEVCQPLSICGDHIFVATFAVYANTLNEAERIQIDPPITRTFNRSPEFVYLSLVKVVDNVLEEQLFQLPLGSRRLVLSLAREDSLISPLRQQKKQCK